MDFDNTCCICFDILYYPVTTKDCNHTFCKECLMSHVDSVGFSCPYCRRRLNLWLRQVVVEKLNIVNEELWLSIQKKYPDKVEQRRQEEAGFASTAGQPVPSTSKDVKKVCRSSKKAPSDTTIQTRPPVTLSKPGEIKKEFDESLRKEREEFEREEQDRLKLSEEFIKLIQVDEAKELAEEQRKRNEQLQEDERLARSLAQQTGNQDDEARELAEEQRKRNEQLQEDERLARSLAQQTADQTQERVETRAIASTSNTQNSSFSCSNCPKTYSLQTSLRVHQRFCSREYQRVRVKLARLSEKTSADADQDSDTQIMESFVCNFCTKEFSTQSGLQSHMRNHNSGAIKITSSMQENVNQASTSNAKNLCFPCERCGKNYSSQNERKIHWRLCSRLRRRVTETNEDLCKDAAPLYVDLVEETDKDLRNDDSLLDVDLVEETNKDLCKDDARLDVDLVEETNKNLCKDDARLDVDLVEETNQDLCKDDARLDVDLVKETNIDLCNDNSLLDVSYLVEKTKSQADITCTKKDNLNKSSKKNDQKIKAQASTKGEKRYTVCEDECLLNEQMELSRVTLLSKRLKTLPPSKAEEERFVCEICTKGFSKEFHLYIHKKVDHTGVKFYKCTKCSFESVYAGLLKQHNMEIHKLNVNQRLDEKESRRGVSSPHTQQGAVHKCTKCSFESVYAALLKQHIMEVHKLSVNPNLHEKESRRGVSSQYTKHGAVHKCTKCSFESVHAGWLEQHNMLIHKQ